MHRCLKMGVFMKITQLVSQFLESNTFIVEKDESVVIVDCGCEIKDVKRVVGDKTVEGIFLTHGHYDHSAYCNDYAKEFGCSIYANINIKQTLADKIAIYSEDYSIIDDFSHFKFVKDDCEIKLKNFDIKCHAFPGHSPCCEGYIIDENFFSGDFLFAKSFGKVNLKNGNKDDMLVSFDKVKNIDFKNIYSGHGEESTKEDLLKHMPVYKKFLTRY